MTALIQPNVIDPAWQRWLSLIQLSVTESEHSSWSECLHTHSHRSPEAPLLHGSSLRVNGDRATDYVRTLADELGIAFNHIDPLAVLLAGVERDDATMDALAQKLTVSIDTVAVLAQLAAVPLLLNAACRIQPEAGTAWQRGYCLVCGAWPSMVELRGIQRERRLRCGCCGSDWMLPVLRCAFCNETDHKKLGYLSSEHGDQHVRVETCATCRGYLKTLTTLSALPFVKLAERDLITVAFDLAARERGYARPERPGWQIEVEIVQ